MGNKTASEIQIQRMQDDKTKPNKIHFTINQEPSSIHIKPDLTKFITIANIGSKKHVPFYLLCDIETGKQIGRRIIIDEADQKIPAPWKGSYSFGYFDEKTEDKTFIFCIGMDSKKIPCQYRFR